MKSLSDYVEQAQTDIFEENGAFFAFGDKQFEEKKVEGVKYVSIGMGLIAPKENADKMMKDLSDTHEKGVALRLEEYGMSKIAQYELGNYECQISMDYSDAHAVLKDYGITDEQMKAEWDIFWAYCVENDLF